MSQKELYFLVREIEYTEVRELHTKMCLAGCEDPDNCAQIAFNSLDDIYYPNSNNLPSKSQVEEAIANGRQRR